MQPSEFASLPSDRVWALLALLDEDEKMQTEKAKAAAARARGRT